LLPTQEAAWQPVQSADKAVPSSNDTTVVGRTPPHLESSPEQTSSVKMFFAFRDQSV